MIILRLVNIPGILLLIVWAGNSHPMTPQVPDILIHNGDTLYIQANPLEPYLQEHNVEIHTWFGEECISTACWRGYQAIWEIVDGSLYLKAIQSCCSDHPVKADLKSIFGERAGTGRVEASWYSGDIRSGRGELIYYVHVGYESVYEEELVFRVEQGTVLDYRIRDNTPTRDATYPGGLDSLKHYIYRNLEWIHLPEMKEEFTVVVIVEVDTAGQVSVSEIQNYHSSAVSVELIRLFNNMSHWEPGYYKGKKRIQSFGIPFKFNADIRREYFR